LVIYLAVLSYQNVG